MAITKTIGQGWTWFTDYAFVWAEWEINAAQGRKIQVGMGVFSGGNPRGEKVEITGSGNIKTLGIGAIHVRVSDGGAALNCTVKLGDSGLIPIIRCASFARTFQAGMEGKVGKSYFDIVSLDSSEIETIEKFNEAHAAAQDIIQRKSATLHSK